MNRRNTIASIVILTLVAIAIIIWRQTCGFWNDDWIYNQFVQPPSSYPSQFDARDAFWKCRNPPIRNFTDIFPSIWNHWHTINGRTIHALVMAGYLIPQWMLLLFVALFICTFLAQLMRFSGITLSSPLIIACALSSYFVIFPWHDHLASFDFCMNYVGTSVFYLLFIRAYSSLKFSPLTGWWKIALLSPAAFLTGMMHEGLSSAVCCGLIYMLVRSLFIKRGKLNLRYWLPLIFFVLGTLLCLSFHERIWLITDKSNEYTVSSHYVFYRMILQAWPLWTGVIALSIVGIKHKCLRSLLLQNMFWIISGVAALCAASRLLGTDRVYWWMYVSGAILLWKSVALSRLPKILSGTRSLIASCSVAILLIFWLSTLAYWQNIFTNEQMKIHAFYDDYVRTTGSREVPKIIYKDLHMPHDAPWWLMYSFECITSYGGITRDNLYTIFNHRDDFGFIIMPEKFKDIEPDSLPPVRGNSGLRGSYNTYWSPVDLSGYLVDIIIGEEWAYTPLGNVNPIYTAQRRLKHKPTHKITIPLFTFKVPRAPGDTLYYYNINNIGRSMYGLPFLQIDTLPKSPNF